MSQTVQKSKLYKSLTRVKQIKLPANHSNMEGTYETGQEINQAAMKQGKNEGLRTIVWL